MLVSLRLRDLHKTMNNEKNEAKSTQRKDAIQRLLLGVICN